MEEHYVNFEIAKLLKEKKFQALCKQCYDTNGTISCKWIDPDIPFNYFNVPYYLCPTCEQVLIFFIREYKLFISIDYDYYEDEAEGKFCFGYTINKMELLDDEYKEVIREVGKNLYPTYEEAMEAAIKHVLENLI